jgi:TPR repeat protein
MSRIANFRAIAIGVTAVGIALLAPLANSVAETSSWSHRTTVAPPKQSASEAADGWTPVPSPVKPRKVHTAPAEQKKAAAPGNAIKEGDPNQEEAAYFAFDQGRYLTALDLAQKAAKNGDPQANTLIGRIYEEGYGVPKDEKLAAQWYAKGAELGDVEAVFALGVLAAQGRGLTKDDAAAARYFDAAAAKGHTLAAYNLALMFLKGSGKPENPYRAFVLMRYAAENGVVAAQYDLGTLYTTGTGTDPNAFEAAKWIGKAAIAGNLDATVEYAVLLFKGHGVPPDQKRGAALFRTAAEKGVPVAQNRLARCYSHGAGVQKNLDEAAKWHLIAKANGVEDAELDKTVARLSKADRSAAESAAADWREKFLVQ